MKRVFQLLAVLMILTSCGSLNGLNGRLRLVRTGQAQEINVVERTSVPMEKEDAISATGELKSSGQLQEPAPVLTESTRADHPVEMEASGVPKTDQKEVFPQELNPDEDEQIADQAYQAERDANTSFWLFFAGLSSAFLPYLGIIPFIIGLVFYSRSKNSRYITQWGDKRSNVATVLLVIDGVILLFWIFLIVLLVLLL